jgi:hypothetical protein
MDKAACAGRRDLDWFDLDCQLQSLIDVCAVCPVGDKCLDYAIEIEADDGVWGGEWGYRLRGYVKRGRGMTRDRGGNRG